MKRQLSSLQRGGKAKLSWRMESTEIVSKANLILLQGEHSPTQYVRADGTLIPSEIVGGCELVEFKCYLRNKYVDLLNSLDRKLATVEEKAVLWNFVKGTFLHDSQRHDALPFVLMYLISSKKTSDALTLFYVHFHLCYQYQRALQQLLEALRLQHPLFTYADLLAYGRGLAALADNPDIERVFSANPDRLKTAEENERHTAAGLVFAHQHLAHPLIRDLMSRRIEMELTAEIPEINDKTTQLREELPRVHFSSVLYEALANAETEFVSTHDKFTLKSSIGNLRSVMECLCQEIVRRTESATGVAFPGRIDRPVEVRQYLANNKVGFLGSHEVNLLASVYAYISEKAVHSLSIDREEALLCRNLALMLSVLLVRRLETIETKIE